MIECPNCGKRNSDVNKFCGECGTELPAPKNYCPICEITFKKDEKFCTQCGYKLVNESEYYIERERLAQKRIIQKKLGPQFIRLPTEEILEKKTKNCPKCRATLGKKIKKCPKCGYKFK